MGFVTQQASHAGDSRHPDHDQWLLDLGRATYAAAGVAGICFDLARVIGGVDSEAMYNDPLGALARRLRPLATKVSPPGMAGFAAQLDAARVARNDLLHALPVLRGLHRRRTDDPSYVRDFFDVADLAAVTTILSAARAEGNRLLYHDGGQSVRDWFARQ